MRLCPFLDGHILWTLREDYHSHYTEYGLLDENLAALEREGKCLILKMGERFVDSHSGINGLLYVIRRVEDAEDFEPAAGGVVPEIVVDTVKAPTTAIVADAASAVLGESATGRYELVNEPGGPVSYAHFQIYARYLCGYEEVLSTCVYAKYKTSSKMSTLDFHGGKLALDTGASLIF